MVFPGIPLVRGVEAGRRESPNERVHWDWDPIEPRPRGTPSVKAVGEEEVGRMGVQASGGGGTGELE